ncbi:ubiquitin carboxyl-terminal hydrolase 8 [Frankliniella occidentalis]|uniref:Ubiquitin carboxyl-terminal hydrolase n=1 Tax=Frankliniella occidentalis TaxID=133901 RepID=A0A6J1TAA3_FRAOC|nr:ubiquitin carboxyl-terminal hydrolase 8 [Frankliniella occidentalis]
MPAPTLKPLIRGKCLQDLKPLYDADFSKRNVSQLLKSAPKILEAAKDNEKRGNQEDSFIHFMKYLSLVGYIINSDEYKKRKTEIDVLKRNMIYAMDSAEKLSKSLKERYEQEKAKTEAVILKEKKEDTKEKPSFSQPNDVLIPETNLEKSRVSLTSMELYVILQEKLSNVLILDARSKNEFLESHIKFDCCISVPEEILGSICSARKLAEKLPSDSRERWIKRLEVEYLVLMDLSSSATNLQSNSPLHRLQTIILQWDPHEKYKSKPLILDGGFREWLNHYPMFSTNSNPKLPLEDFDDHLHIDDVVYPELADETPQFSRTTKPAVKEIGVSDGLADEKGVQLFPNGKDISTIEIKVEAKEDPSQIPVNEISSGTNLKNQSVNSFNIPNVDRSSKFAALKTYNELGNSKSRNDIPNKDRNTLFLNEKNLLMNEENDILKKQDDEFGGEKGVDNVPPKSSGLSSITGDIKSIGESERQSLSKLRGNPSTPTAAKNIDLSVPTSSSGLKRSRSSPNIAQAVQDSEPKAPLPHFDRNSKPVIQKPQNLEFINRQRNFQEVYGNVKQGLTGLRNLGNSCYMNSILQCISNISVLSNYFCSGKYKEDMNRSPSNPTRGEVADEVAHVIRNLWMGQYRSIACRDFKRVVGKHMDQFRGCGQQDAHEFLTFLMDWLHNDLKMLKEDHVKEISNSLAGSNKSSNVDALTGGLNAWKDFRSKHESFMLAAFFIQQVSTVQCCICGAKSMNFEEPTSNLTLLLPSTQKCTLSECLRLYITKEKISGYKCESCHGLHDAEKSVDLCRLPPILIIHLKRFYASGFYQKRQTFVDFPLENLDMRDYTPNVHQTNTIYNLCGVSNHYGTLEGGHYTAYCKNGGKWYKYDDQDVSEISRSSVKTQNAYILFYEAVN